jgi:SpoVK/Ycf46/Vps4 family AAA+-type ATPase
MHPYQPLTGLSSRALAQKLSIRLRKRFSHGKFIEINSHSLFSRWFGGSAKLVGKIFEEIEDLVDEDEDTFVCVLIDEIESLTSSRQSAASGSEPGDSMRVGRTSRLRSSLRSILTYLSYTGDKRTTNSSRPTTSSPKRYCAMHEQPHQSNGKPRHPPSATLLCAKR